VRMTELSVGDGPEGAERDVAILGVEARLPPQ